MRISVETPFCLAAVNEIYLDGVLQSLCIGADDVEGVVERYKVDKKGNPILDGGDTITEVLAGKVEIRLNKGWSFKNGRFFLDASEASSYWKKSDET